MSKTEYNEYVASVARFLTANNVKPGCYGPVNPENEQPEFFSWRPCECCGSRLGGSRYAYQFTVDKPALFVDENPIQTFPADICADCVYYLTYGCLDDATMAEIEAQS